MTGRVIVVGSINVDLVVTADRLPAPGETVTGGRFDRHDGGKGANQAVAASRLGAPTSFVGAVGDDAYGERARAALVDERVDVRELLVMPGEPTGVAVILVGAAGENLIAVASGANTMLGPKQAAVALDRLAIGPADVIIVGHEIPTATTRAVLRRASGAGARSILNPAPAHGLDRSTFGLAGVVTPNRSELAVLVRAEAARLGRPFPAPDDPERAARTLVEPNAEGAGATAVLVTLGPLGAVLVERGGTSTSLAAPGVRPIDTVGAGDALNGALAAELADGRPLEDAARRAVVAAGLSTTRPGARAGMPTRDELEAVLRPG